MTDTLKPIGLTVGTVCTVDDEIAQMERLIDQRRIDHMITVAVEKEQMGLRKVHILTMGTALGTVREALQVALGAVKDMTGS